MSDTDYCPYIDDPCEVWVETTRRAAKRHVCCECGGAIERGEMHQMISSLYYGAWYRYRTCAACLRGPLAFVERNCGGGRMTEGLFEHLAEVASSGSLRSVFAEGQVARWMEDARRRRAARVVGR